MIQTQHKFFHRVALSIDLFLVIVSFFLGYLIRYKIYDIFPSLSTIELLPLAPLNYYLAQAPLLLVIWGVLLSYFGMYKSFYVKMSESLLIILKTALIGFTLFGSYIFILKMQQQVSRIVILLTFFFAAILISLEKGALIYAYRIISGRDLSFKSTLIVLRRILIIGTGQRALNFIGLINKNPGWGIKIVGLVDMDSSRKGEIIHGYKILGSFEDVPEIIHENIIDEVLFVVPLSWLDRIEGIMQFCENEGIKVNLAADFFNLKLSNVKHTNIYGFPLLTFESTPDKLGHLFLKRIFDFVFSCIVLFLFSLSFLIISVIIKITSKGPVFYSQIRCGLYGRKFTIYKFRTMVVDAESRLADLLKYNEMEGPVFKMTNDPRVTKVGKWLRKYSIDELPQLWNVLKGDMSLVGPRPPLPEEVGKYTPYQRRRLSMRPGITCLWQISGRSKISDFNEWMKLDLEYIDNWSLGRDLTILLKSIPVVLFGEGAK